MSPGLPRLNITVTPSLHAQAEALAKAREETLSDVLRLALDSWDGRKTVRIERKSKALSVRLTEAQRLKLDRAAKRMGLSAAACMAVMVEHLAHSSTELKAPEGTPKPAAKQRKRPQPQSAEKQPTKRTRKKDTRASSLTPSRAPEGKAARSTGTTSKKQPRPKRASRAATEPAALDLPSFAKLVQSIADTTREGRFGPYKVFVSSVWRRLEGTPLAGMSLDDFKRSLTQANRLDLLALHRADLVSAMDPVKVQESETPYLNATFHFIESPRRD